MKTFIYTLRKFTLMQEKCKIGIVFLSPSSGALGEPPKSEELFKEREKRIMQKLNQLFPDILFESYTVRNLEELSEALNKSRDVIGYVAFLLNSLYGLAKPIIDSDKPVILIAETYGGAGDFLLDYNRAQIENKKVIGVVTRDIEDENLLKRYITYLYVIYKLHHSRILFILSPGVRTLTRSEFPLSVDLYSYLKRIQSIFGITSIMLESGEFVQKYYNKVSDDEARKVADNWIKMAKEIVEKDTKEIIKSAKLYLAMKNAIKDYNADAIAIDCITLYRNGFLDAWPCLGYMELIRRDEAIPVCEADAFSAALLLLMKHLANRPGFINDPSPDIIRGEIVYYHCFAPITPYGYGDQKVVPYTITPAHLGGKKASIYVEAPTGETVTVVGLSPEERIITIHTAEVVRNEYSELACSTKIIGRANVAAIINNYNWRAGWHRVLFYGDWRDQLREVALLLGLRVIEEDKKD